MARGQRLSLGLELVTFFFLFSQAFPRELPKRSGYQTLNLTEYQKIDSYDEPKKIFGSSSKQERGPWTLPVFHRDEPSSPFRKPGANRQELLLEMLKRDAVRVQSINTRLKLALEGVQSRDMKRSHSASHASQESFSSPVVSGTNEGSGEFFTRIGIGTPQRASYLVMDTGSDLSWLQCLPCQSCYEQSDPIFNPAFSSSFRPVTCSSPMCSEVDTNVCRNQHCYYQVSYADGSLSAGNVGVETFSFGRTRIENVGMGCGHVNEGLFAGAAGLLGLGAGAVSFTSQIASRTGGVFSYCLSNIVRGGPSSLVFGEGAVPEGASFTPMLKNPMIDTFYYVSLTGISIDGSPVSISASDLSLKSTGTGGVIIDSGTTITHLVTPVYDSLRAAFAAAAQKRHLRFAGSYDSFDTCYDFGGMQYDSAPSVALHFEGGATLALPVVNYLQAVGEGSPIACLAFAAAAPGDVSIIGNMQQQGFRISFDTRYARVGFKSNQCAGN